MSMDGQQENPLQSILGLVMVLALVAFGYAVVATFPVSLLLILTAVLLWLAFVWSDKPHLKGLVPFLYATAAGCTLVWIAQLVFWLAKPDISADTIAAIEDFAIQTHRQFKSVTSFGWGAFIAAMAILGIISYYRPKWQLVSNALLLKKWTGAVTVALTIATSFTFLGDVAVFSPAEQEAVDHYRVAIRNSQEREAFAVKSRFAVKAAEVAVQAMPEADLASLREFAWSAADSKLRDEILKGEARSGKTKPEVTIAEEPPPRPESKADVETQLAGQRERTAAAEESLKEEVRAFRKILENAAGVPKDRLFDTVAEHILRVSFDEGSAFGTIAKLFAERAADVAWDRVAGPAIEKVGTRILARLQTRGGMSGAERAEQARIAVERSKLYAFADLLERQAEAAERLKEAVERGGRNGILSAKTTYDLYRIQAMRMTTDLHTAGLMGAGDRVPPQFASDPRFRDVYARIENIKVEVRVPPEVLKRVEAVRVEVARPKVRVR